MIRKGCCPGDEPSPAGSNPFSLFRPSVGACAKLFQFFDFYGFVTCFCPKSGNKSPYFKKLEQMLT